MQERQAKGLPTFESRVVISLASATASRSGPGVITSVKGITPQELAAYGIHNVSEIVYNPSYDLLFQEETKPTLEGYERGTLTTTGAIAVDTGIFTGRSPKR